MKRYGERGRGRGRGRERAGMSEKEIDQQRKREKGGATMKHLTPHHHATITHNWITDVASAPSCEAIRLQPGVQVKVYSQPAGRPADDKRCCTVIIREH